MSLVTGRVRIIENWGQLWRKWVTVIHISKITCISWYPPSQASFCHLPAGPAALLWALMCCVCNTDQPLAHGGFRLCFSTWLPENQEKKLQVLQPLRRLHVSMWLSLPGAEFPSVLSWVEALKFWLQPERCDRGGNTVTLWWHWHHLWWHWQLSRTLRMLISLERCTWDASPHIHAPVSVCPGGCTASPSRPGLSSAQLSYAVIAPPDGTADILLEIQNNSLLKPTFQAII